MNGSVTVWDLETVPDLRGFAAANELAGKTDGEVREAIGDKFPKHIYHSIVCIGALVARREDDHWTVEALGAPHVGERTEKELISAFVGKIVGRTGRRDTLAGCLLSGVRHQPCDRPADRRPPSAVLIVGKGVETAVGKLVRKDLGDGVEVAVINQPAGHMTAVAAPQYNISRRHVLSTR
jgi:hypothetical protein